MTEEIIAGQSDLTAVTTIDAEKLKRMLALHVRFLILDLRSEVSFAQGHVPGALNFPEKVRRTFSVVGTFGAFETPTVLYDEGGSAIEAKELALALEKLGYINVVVLEDGYQSFVQAFSKI